MRQPRVKSTPELPLWQTVAASGFAPISCSSSARFPSTTPRTRRAPHRVRKSRWRATTVSRVVDYTFLGDLTLNKSRAAKIALNLLRLHLLRQEKPAEPQD